MRCLGVVLAIALSACNGPTEPSNTAAVTAVVTVSLPDEPAARWTGAGGALIERHCVACHSAEMIANQPPLAPEKWQATIEKMRTVYKAQIATSDDAALVAALTAIQKGR